VDSRAAKNKKSDCRNQATLKRFLVLVCNAELNEPRYLIINYIPAGMNPPSEGGRQPESVFWPEVITQVFNPFIL
jgi:hypothetical protein